jgi:hypothetical protein
MDNEFLTFALQTTIDELQTVCPDIKTVFAIDSNRELIAQGENTPENSLARAVELLREVLEKVEALGGAEDLTIHGTDGTINVSCMGEIYIVTVTSKNADIDHVNTLVHVAFPTVLKVLEKLGPVPITGKPPESELEPETSTVNETEKLSEPAVEETKAELPEDEAEHKQEPEKILPEPPVNQFIVEDIKGLLTPSDTVRVDNNVIEQWKELYEGRSLEEADLETFTGKSLRCKVKSIKDGKLEGQGKIQIPSKLQDVLDIKKGELVRVKPAIE